MKPDAPEPRDFEWRITALILGELSDDESVPLREEIEKNPDLRLLYERIEAASELVKEAALLPTDSASALKLSPDRRERLLARIKAAPIAAASGRGPDWAWLRRAAPLAAVAMILMALALPLFLPALSRGKAKAQRMAAFSGYAAAPLEHLAKQSESKPSAQGLMLGDEAKVGRVFRGVEVSSQSVPKDSAITGLGITAETEGRPAASMEGAKDEFGALTVQNRAFFELRNPEAPQLTLPPSGPIPAVPLVGKPATPLPESAPPGVTGGLVAADAVTAAGSDAMPEAAATARFSRRSGVRPLGELDGKLESRRFEARTKYANAAAGVDLYMSNRSVADSDVQRKLQLAESKERALGWEFTPGVPTASNELGQQPLSPSGGAGGFGGGAAHLGSYGGRPADFADRNSIDFDSGLTAAKQNDKLARELNDQPLDTLADRSQVKSKADQLRVAEERFSFEKVPSLLTKAKPAPEPQPEVATAENAFSTFSLNVSDVSFKLAAASLQNGTLPDPNLVRPEEFLNALNYRDPEPGPGLPLAFAWERARWPFAQNRDLLRFSVKTAAAGRSSATPLNLVVLLDNSGSMERADRVRIVNSALRVLAAKLQGEDRFSLITFARTPRVWVEGLSGDQALKWIEDNGDFSREGGTNLEEALNEAYRTAQGQFLPNANNRVVLLTDGAANLGNVDAEPLKNITVQNRQQGIALDCFGVGWEGYNDDLLENLTRNADGRYGFLNDVEQAAPEFASQLAGALQVAASDVKVQVQFNPERVKVYRQVGYAKHQLTKEQFRDNTVDAAEIGAAESGNAAYVVEVDPAGQGPLATVRVRYRDARQNTYEEKEWLVPYLGAAPALEQASPSLRLAGVAVAFSEWLANNPFSAEATPDRLLPILQGVPQIFGQDPQPETLAAMLRQAESIGGR